MKIKKKTRTVKPKVSASKAKKAKTQPVFEYLWYSKFITDGAQTIDDVIDIHHQVAKFFEDLKADGVIVDQAPCVDGFIHLVTTDPAVAEKYDFEKFEVEDDLGD